MKRSLYEISAELSAIEDALLESAGEADAQLEAWFDAIGAERDEKVKGYCQLIANLEADAESCQAEANRLRDMSLTNERATRRLKDRLKTFFEIHGITKFDLVTFKPRIQANGGAVPLIVPAEWEAEPASAPEAFQRRVIQLDKEAIREAIRNDEETHGAFLGPKGTHLRIK